MRIYILLLFCMGICCGAFAQGRVRGKVLEDKTYIGIGGVKVENVTNHAVNVSDETGAFSIVAKSGDILHFSSVGYKRDTILITEVGVLTVYLTLDQNMLKEVQVKEIEFPPGAFKPKSVMGPMGSKTVRYQTDKNGNPIGGVKASISSLFGDSKAETEKKINGYTQDVQVAEAFNEKTLGPYLPISGQELSNFVVLYRPDANTFYDKNFKMTDYINACYRKFMQIPAEKRRSKELVSLK